MFHSNGENPFSDAATNRRVRVPRIRVPIAPFFLITAVFVLTGYALPVAPQKSKIEQELDKKDTGNKTAPPTSAPKSGHTRSVSRKRAAIEFPVTFISDVPGAEISLDGTVIGKVNDEKRLMVKVRQGRYIARASMKGYNPQSVPVAVFGQAIYTVLLGKPIPAPAPTPVVAEPTPEPVAPVETPPPSFDDILRRFIDPVETNKLTVAEWQEVTDKSDATTEQGAARIHLGKGQLAFFARNYAESVSEFNRATAALPRSGIAYYGLGNAYLATNQPNEAVNAYKRAIELTPEVAALANKGLGDALTKLRKFNEANSYYFKARDNGYVSPEINKRIAQNLMGEKQWKKALAELEAIEGEDSTGERYLYMGECYENLGRSLNAFQAYKKATEIAPNSAVAFAKLGDVLFAEKDFVSAHEAYERALALDTTGTVIDRQQIRKRANTAASQMKKK
jgi:Tfp pilus assembly protein PilF